MSKEDTTSESSPELRAWLAGAFTFSTLVLVIANLVPIAGAFYFGWDLASVLIIYWAESAVVGFYNFCKIIVIGGKSSVFYGFFFLGHFGAFMAVHFTFLYQIFIEGMESDSSVSIEQAINLFGELWPAVVALFISHGISFFQNFLGRKEYRNRTVKIQMTEPYQRIIFMHLVIIIGAGLTTILGDSSAVLLLVIIAKIMVDVRAHVRERMDAEKSGSIL